MKVKVSFYIDIEKDLTTNQFITAFCHEMVHVIQHLRDKPISEKEAYKIEGDLAAKFKLELSNWIIYCQFSCFP